MRGRMKDKSQKFEDRREKDSVEVSRRQFIGRLGMTAAGAAAITAGGLPFVGGTAVETHAAGNSEAPGRMNDCFNYRRDMALAQRLNVGTQKDNGDSARFSD